MNQPRWNGLAATTNLDGMRAPPPSENRAAPAGVVARFDRAGGRLSVAVPLTVAGGFLDAFAWVAHGHVFANAMSGNVALLGIHAAAGEWRQALRHVPPLLAFMAAVFAARAVRLPGPARLLRSPPLACLAFEIAVLALGATFCRALPDAVLIPGIAFVATLQTSTFTHLESMPYASVMTTGNLRRFVGELFSGLVERRDPAAPRNAALFGAICLSFLAGALLGGFATDRAPNAALWVPVMVLGAALPRMVWLARNDGD